ncbi:MAG: hypothetical protein KGQ54_03800 [Verrucomicrobia bacterium]|nr:hypothetical protein [Verrucomicrobiota bacterium]
MACQILFNLSLQRLYESNYFDSEKLVDGFWKPFGDARQKIQNCEQIIEALIGKEEWASKTGDLYEFVLIALSPGSGQLKITAELLNVFCRGLLVLATYMILLPEKKYAIIGALYITIWPSLYLFTSQALRDTILLTIFALFLLSFKKILQGWGDRLISIFLWAIFLFAIIYDLRVYTAVFFAFALCATGILLKNWNQRILLLTMSFLMVWVSSLALPAWSVSRVIESRYGEKISRASIIKRCESLVALDPKRNSLTSLGASLPKTISYNLKQKAKVLHSFHDSKKYFGKSLFLPLLDIAAFLMLAFFFGGRILPSLPRQPLTDIRKLSLVFVILYLPAAILLVDVFGNLYRICLPGVFTLLLLVDWPNAQKNR